MLRSNHCKNKRCQAHRTLLLFGEGFNEEIFFKHLRSIYAHQSDVAVTIKKGNGGDAYNIVIDAYKIPGDYDRKIVILDNDKTKAEMIKARQEAKKRNIELIENTPCLESLLISILDKKPDNKSSAWCKKEFESKYISRKKRGEPVEYSKIFTKRVLDGRRYEIPELNVLILIMEGRGKL